jgi:hypothetical protein
MNTALKIILVDENTGRSAMLRRALQICQYSHPPILFLKLYS